MPQVADCQLPKRQFTDCMRVSFAGFFGANGIHMPRAGAWQFKDAYRTIFEQTSSEDLPELARLELPSIITHWLHDINSSPLLLGEAAGNRWRNILQKAAGRKDFRVGFTDYPFYSAKNSFRFIDLFAGIGGFRIALQAFGGKCVFSSEWDIKAKETYLQNYAEIPFGDISLFSGKNVSDDFIKKNIPDHDVLTAGFPCQPFSLAGVSARNSLGKKHGFCCKVQGTLFFDIARIASIKRPKVIFMENVKNLISHENGKTFETIQDVIKNHLGYSFYWKEIDSCTLVPQRRKRIYMICIRDPKIHFSFPSFNGIARPLSSILEPNPDSKYTLSTKMWKGHQKRTRRNLQRGTGFTANIADITKPANTIVARYYKDGKECLIPTASGLPRMLTIKEAARLQGYHGRFKPHTSRSSAYKQFGNSVSVPVVKKLAYRISMILDQIS